MSHVGRLLSIHRDSTFAMNSLNSYSADRAAAAAVDDIAVFGAGAEMPDVVRPVPADAALNVHHCRS